MSYKLMQFQSTLPQGERPLSGPHMSQIRNFNPRSHEGSDRTVKSITRSPIYFNPRSHEGSDGIITVIQIGRVISIHAPTRGATAGYSAQSFFTYYFNPRSHEGSDSNFTQNSISVLFHFYQSFPHIIFPHTARFRLLIIFCTFFLVRIAQRFPVCFHFAPKQYSAFYNVCSTDLL